MNLLLLHFQIQLLQTLQMKGSDGAEPNTITESYTHQIGLTKYASLAGKICLVSEDNQECDEENQDLSSPLLGVQMKVEDRTELHE